MRGKNINIRGAQTSTNFRRDMQQWPSTETMRQLSPGVRGATMSQHHEERTSQHAVVPKWARANEAALKDTTKLK